jgi:hypothetical protein
MNGAGFIAGEQQLVHASSTGSDKINIVAREIETDARIPNRRGT